MRLRDGTCHRYWDDRDLRVRSVSRGRGDGASVEASGRRRLSQSASGGGKRLGLSSRCLRTQELGTIHTTDFIPPDLNSLLYQLELTIAKGCEVTSDAAGTKDLARAPQSARLQ